MKNYLKVIIAFVVAVVVGFGIVYLIKNFGPKGKGMPSNTSVVNSTTVKEENTPSAVVAEEPIIPESEGIKEASVPSVAPTLTISGAKTRLSVGKTEYFYTVSGIKAGEPAEDITFILSDNYGHRYTSKNGTFSKVAANAAGTYSIIASSSSSGLSSETKSLRGFNTVQPVENKLTASELTSLFATGDYDGNKSRLEGKLAKSVAISSSNTEYKCNTIPEVFMSVGLENWNVSVSAIEYNCLGQVSAVTLSAQK